MHPIFRWMSMAAVAALAGCGGLKEIQEPIGRFGEAAHTVSAAEMTYLRAVQSADCTNQFYTTAFLYATDRGNFDLSGSCAPTILDDQQIQIRQALMNAITLYADKIVAIATSDDDKKLDDNSQKVAANLNKLAKQQGKFGSLKVAKGVEAAVIAIADMRIDQIRLKEVKQAAAVMQPNLEKIVEALKGENSAFASGIASKVDTIELQLRAIVADNHKKRGSMSVFDVVEARRMLQAANPLNPVALASSEGASDPRSNPHNVAAQLNDLLDAILNANRAIATAGTGGIKAAVNDLAARGRAAGSIYSALNK